MGENQMRILNKTEVLREMEKDIEALTEENYHTEAEYLSVQRDALNSVHLDGDRFNYFSWHASDVGGLNEVWIS
jgi:hypothetical protein